MYTLSVGLEPTSYRLTGGCFTNLATRVRTGGEDSMLDNPSHKARPYRSHLNYPCCGLSRTRTCEGLPKRFTVPFLCRSDHQPIRAINGNRTHNRLFTKQLLCQLSYNGVNVSSDYCIQTLQDRLLRMVEAAF